MNVSTNHINEQEAAEAFSRQSLIFDSIYGSDTIIRYKRERVREHIVPFLSPGATLLELNCGTGEDAIYFARLGYQVHATDISTAMLDRLRKKIEGTGIEAKITTEECSFTQLNTLGSNGPFDMVYSNFGGLNCTGELGKVLESLGAIVKPGGMVTLVIISKFCLWETLLFFRGKFKTAFRRFFSKQGRKAHVEGTYFKCWYYPPSFIRKKLAGQFNLVAVEGLCTLVPPSYIEGFAQKHPKLYNYLVRKENSLKRKWPWRNVGDYFIITLRKK